MPKPNTAERDSWLDQGACKGMDVALFYPKPPRLLIEGRGRPPKGEVLMQAAKDACDRCPVQMECADWAIPHEAHGYWGGLTERERAHIRNAEGIILWEPQNTASYMGNLTPSGDPRVKMVKIVHGTSRGYKMEKRRGMLPCDDCRIAHSRQTAISKENRERLSA